MSEAPLTAVESLSGSNGYVRKPSGKAIGGEPIPLRRSLADPEPFPLEALGSLLGSASACLGETIQAPAALCAQSILAGATLAVQGHADVVIDGRRAPLSEFFLTIGESGERKSAVDRVVMHEFRERERRLSEEHLQAKQSFTNELAAFEKQRAETSRSEVADLKAALDALGSPPSEPLLPFYLCDEPTIEGIWKLTEKGQPSIGLFSDEGGRMIGGHGMTAENQIRTVTGLSKFWDGDPISRVRSGDGASVLYGRRLSMHLMAQPAVVSALLSNEVLLGQGIMSRVLPCFPVSTTGTRLYKSVDISREPALSRFHDRVRRILDCPFTLAESSRNQLQPRALGLSPSAKHTWIQFHDAIETQLGAEGPLASIRGFGAKVAEHALRLSGTLTLFENLEAAEINGEAMAGAIDLAQFYLSEALRLFNSSMTPPDLVQAERLLEWARKQDRLYLPHVYQFGPNSIRDSKTARHLLGLLENHGWIIRVPEGAEIDGKKRRDVWKLWRSTDV